ncbi:TPA: hypothetical protein ACH3X3_003202 [Trebouxia sp. C0006]
MKMKGSHQDTPNKPLQQASKGLLGRAVASVQTCLRNYILRTVTPKLVSELLAVYAENARLKADINRLQQEKAAESKSIATDFEDMLLSILGQYTHYMHETKAASCAMVLALLSAHTSEADLQRKLVRANSRADAAEARSSWI